MSEDVIQRWNNIQQEQCKIHCRDLQKEIR